MVDLQVCRGNLPVECGLDMGLRLDSKPLEEIEHPFDVGHDVVVDAGVEYPEIAGERIR